MNELKLTYEGFEPSSDLRQLIKIELEHLHLRCPSSSHIEFKIERNERLNKWTTSLVLKSNVLYFSHKSISKSLPEAVQKTIKLSWESVRNWSTLKNAV